MANSMQWPAQPDQVEACALCDIDSSDTLNSAPGAASCFASACAMFVGIDNISLQALRPITVKLVSALRNNRGRLLEGPDPFPPRYSKI